jgi:hypothetical protein
MSNKLLNKKENQAINKILKKIKHKIRRRIKIIKKEANRQNSRKSSIKIPKNRVDYRRTQKLVILIQKVKLVKIRNKQINPKLQSEKVKTI